LCDRGPGEFSLFVDVGGLVQLTVQRPLDDSGALELQRQAGLLGVEQGDGHSGATPLAAQRLQLSHRVNLAEGGDQPFGTGEPVQVPSVEGS